jgi:hypothetical protein
MPAPKITHNINVKLLEAGWSPNTNRFYPKAVFDVIQNQFQTPSIGDFMFDADTSSMRLNLANASHRTNRIYTKNDGTELWADISILDTDCGRLVRDLYTSKNVKFDCLMLGNINRFDEVQADSVQFLRVIAFGVY